MRRMSAALKADWNVSIIRRKLLQANARLEAFALQIEAVRYKKSAEWCRIVSRLILISATLPAKPIEDSLRVHWIRYIDSICRMYRRWKNLWASYL